MDEMIRGLRFDGKSIARVGQEGEFIDKTGLAMRVEANWAVGTWGFVNKPIIFPLFHICFSISIIKSSRHMYHVRNFQLLKRQRMY